MSYQKKKNLYVPKKKYILYKNIHSGAKFCLKQHSNIHNKHQF